MLVVNPDLNYLISCKGLMKLSLVVSHSALFLTICFNASEINFIDTMNILISSFILYVNISSLVFGTVMKIEHPLMIIYEASVTLILMTGICFLSYLGQSIAREFGVSNICPKSIVSDHNLHSKSQHFLNNYKLNAYYNSDCYMGMWYILFGQFFIFIFEVYSGMKTIGNKNFKSELQEISRPSPMRWLSGCLSDFLVKINSLKRIVHLKWWGFYVKSSVHKLFRG